MKSIMEDLKNRTCWACGAYAPEEHHVFYGVANRKMSEKYGLKVHLCSRHHRDHREGVHGQNKELDHRLKVVGQRVFETHHGTRERFVQIFGRNYLEEDGSRRHQVLWGTDS